MVHQLMTTLVVASILLGIVGIALLAIEVAIRKGWEPHFLEVYRPACEILEQEHLPNGKSNVTVRLHTGDIEAYEADEEETKEIQVGSISHLWVIGAYISRIKFLSKSAGIYIPSGHRRFGLKPNSRPVLASITIALSTLLSGYLTAYGIVVAVGGSMIVHATNDQGTPQPEMYMGTETSFLGLLFALGGIAIFGYVAYLWWSGWDETTFTSHSDQVQDWS